MITQEQIEAVIRPVAEEHAKRHFRQEFVNSEAYTDGVKDLLTSEMALASMREFGEEDVWEYAIDNSTPRLGYIAREAMAKAGFNLALLEG